MKYRCKECGDEFIDIGEAEFHSYDFHEREFEEIMEILEEENLTIDDTPEETENLDESEAITEEEVRGAIILENYDQIEDETTKKQVLSVALGQSTGHDKKFAKPVKTSEAFKEAYSRIIEKLQNEESVACPICGLEWSRIEEDMKENLGFDTQHSNLEGKFPVVRIHHIQASHPSIWKLLAYLFEIPEKTEVGVQKVQVSNPESCSKEELAQVISESPELRKEFYREWIKKLQKRE